MHLTARPKLKAKQNVSKPLLTFRILGPILDHISLAKVYHGLILSIIEHCSPLPVKTERVTSRRGAAKSSSSDLWICRFEDVSFSRAHAVMNLWCQIANTPSPSCTPSAVIIAGLAPTPFSGRKRLLFPDCCVDNKKRSLSYPLFLFWLFRYFVLLCSVVSFVSVFRFSLEIWFLLNDEIWYYDIKYMKYEIWYYNIFLLLLWKNGMRQW